VFGTVDQDAKRRDFSINALYYDPIAEQIFDFNNAMDDFKKKKISSIIDLKYSFIEDPVRMLRAIKYSITTDFNLKLNIRLAIRKHHSELSKVSTSRLTEEVNKILASGYSRDIFVKLKKYRLLVYLLPCFNVYASLNNVQNSLLELDYKVRRFKNSETDEVPRHIMLLHLVQELIIFSEEDLTSRERFKETFRQVKVLISPMTPSNYEVELCCEQLLKLKGYKVPKGCVRHPKTSSKNNANFEKRRKYTAKKRNYKKYDTSKKPIKKTKV